jgi:CheY-like chemotaxis protein
MSRRRVLIVDDNAEFRRLARRLLEHGGYEVVGEAADAARALRAHAALRPDIVLLDVQLPDLDGFALAETLAADEDPPIVVLISSRDRGAYRFKLAATTARAFLPKGELSLRTFDQAISA